MKDAIIRLWSGGYSEKAIARHLNVTEKMVNDCIREFFNEV